MSRANAQYNLARPDSLAIRVASKVRSDIFRRVMAEFSFSESDEVLDLGVTSDQSYTSSNYFEMLYPYKDKIVAAGIDDARFLEELYPGLRFVHADALDLPFEDGAFDYVHSSAVLEHVGCFENQRKMVAECARVARKGFCLTTPTAGFRSSFTPNCRFCTGCRRHGSDSSLRRLEQPELAKEENLNLMSERDLRKTVAGVSGWSFRFDEARLLGVKSNLILFGHRDAWLAGLAI